MSFVPPNGQVHLGADRAGVDVRDAGLEVAHRAEGLVDVAREDRGREAELDRRSRRESPRRSPRTADQRRRRAEDLLLRDPHLRVDVAEDRRPVEEALVEAVPGRDLAAGEELRALVLADLRVRVDLLERALVDDRADVGVVVPARRRAAASRPRRRAATAAARRPRPATITRDCGRAALAGGAERRPDDPVDREIEIGVVEDDDRVLAAELEVDALQVVGARSASPRHRSRASR